MSKGKRKRERKARMAAREETTGELERGAREVLRGDPIIVHIPNEPSLELAAGDTYRAACGRMVRLPDTVAQHRDEKGFYFIAGPHRRYHDLCPGCARSEALLGYSR